jgi:hypothetical protein
MEQAMRLAELMSKARLVPEHLQGKPGDCLLIIEQAGRWSMSPYAVAQCSSLVHGRLCYEGKLVAAAVESLGAIDGHFDYTFTGSGDALEVTVSAVRSGEKVPKTITLKWKDAYTVDKEGRVQKHWSKQAEQQLCYAGTRIWARRWTPAVILGVYVREEFESGGLPDGKVIDAVAEPAGGDPREAVNATVPLKDTPAPETTEEKPRQTFTEWKAGIAELLGQAQSIAGVEAIVKHEDVQKILFEGRPKQQEALTEMLEEAKDRVALRGKPQQSDEAPDTMPDADSQQADKLVKVLQAFDSAKLLREYAGSDAIRKVLKKWDDGPPAHQALKAKVVEAGEARLAELERNAS